MAVIDYMFDKSQEKNKQEVGAGLTLQNRQMQLQAEARNWQAMTPEQQADLVKRQKQLVADQRARQGETGKKLDEAESSGRTKETIGGIVSYAPVPGAEELGGFIASFKEESDREAASLRKEMQQQGEVNKRSEALLAEMVKHLQIIANKDFASGEGSRRDAPLPGTFDQLK
jgi:hypothetical protein